MMIYSLKGSRSIYIGVDGSTREVYLCSVRGVVLV